MTLLIRNVKVLTPTAEPARWPLRGRDQGAVSVAAGVDVLCDGPRIARVGVGVGAKVGEGCRVLEGGGRLLTPGLVDCHTHACWAGDRLGEWERKLRGATYLEILASGGGIMSTVRAVRGASERELSDLLLERLEGMLASGTTTVEVKSGYGLTTEAELRMLRAVAGAASRWRGTVVATALLGHAKDPDEPGMAERVVRETLPAVHAEFPGAAVDAFCEAGAWSREECVGLLEAARGLGHPVRVHADQFTSMGMAAEAVRLGAASMDHLEASTGEDLARLAAGGVTGVGLPVCGLHVDDRYAALGALVAAGGAAAVASNMNPGSAPSGSLALAMGLAVRRCGLTVGEAWTACTANAAAVLGLADRGAVAAGLRADLVLWSCRDEREVAYWVGGPGVDAVICGGEVVD